MWKHDNMKVHMGIENKMAILSDKFGYPDIPIPENTIISNTNITDENVKFSKDAFIQGDSHNPIDINFNKTGAYMINLYQKVEVEAEKAEAEKVEAEKVEAEKVEAEKVEAEKVEAEKTKIAGQIMSLPHNIYLYGCGSNNSILSTHLAVDPEYRKKRYAETLILTTIKTSFDNNIKIGYHWIKEKKTDLAMESYYWYRPLSLSKILNKGYGLQNGISYSPPTQDSEIKHFPTKSDDFKLLRSGPRIRLFLTDKQLIDLGNVITFFTIKHKDTIVGIFGFRKFDIVKTKYTVDAVQLCYFDSSTNYEAKVFAKIIYILKELDFAAVHGVLMSNLVNVVKKMNITLVDSVFLDFCNISHPNLSITDVALLYI
jgi:nucleoid-associated protein YgaU